MPYDKSKSKILIRLLNSKAATIFDKLREGIEENITVRVPEHTRRVGGRTIQIPAYEYERGGTGGPEEEAARIPIRRYEEGAPARTGIESTVARRPAGGSGRRIAPSERGRPIKMTEAARLYRLIKRRIDALREEIGEGYENDPQVQELERRKEIVLRVYNIAKDEFERAQQRLYPEGERVREPGQRVEQPTEPEPEPEDILNEEYERALDIQYRFNMMGPYTYYAKMPDTLVETNIMFESARDVNGMVPHGILEFNLPEEGEETNEALELLKLVEEKGYKVHQRVTTDGSYSYFVLQFENPENGQIYELRCMSPNAQAPDLFEEGKEVLWGLDTYINSSVVPLEAYYHMSLADAIKHILHTRLRKCHHHPDYDRDRCHDPEIEHRLSDLSFTVEDMEGYIDNLHNIDRLLAQVQDVEEDRDLEEELAEIRRRLSSRPIEPEPEEQVPEEPERPEIVSTGRGTYLEEINKTLPEKAWVDLDSVEMRKMAEWSPDFDPFDWSDLIGEGAYEAKKAMLLELYNNSKEQYKIAEEAGNTTALEEWGEKRRLWGRYYRKLLKFGVFADFRQQVSRRAEEPKNFALVDELPFSKLKIRESSILTYAGINTDEWISKMREKLQYNPDGRLKKNVDKLERTFKKLKRAGFDVAFLPQHFYSAGKVSRRDVVSGRSTAPVSGPCIIIEGNGMRYKIGFQHFMGGTLAKSYNEATMGNIITYDEFHNVSVNSLHGNKGIFDEILMKKHRTQSFAGLVKIIKELGDRAIEIRNCHHHPDYDDDKCHDPEIKHRKGDMGGKALPYEISHAMAREGISLYKSISKFGLKHKITEEFVRHFPALEELVGKKATSAAKSVWKRFKRAEAKVLEMVGDQMLNGSYHYGRKPGKTVSGVDITEELELYDKMLEKVRKLEEDYSEIEDTIHTIDSTIKEAKRVIKEERAAWNDVNGTTDGFNQSDRYKLLRNLIARLRRRRNRFEVEKLVVSPKLSAAKKSFKSIELQVGKRKIRVKKPHELSEEYNKLSAQLAGLKAWFSSNTGHKWAYRVSMPTINSEQMPRIFLNLHSGYGQDILVPDSIRQTLYPDILDFGEADSRQHENHQGRNRDRVAGLANFQIQKKDKLIRDRWKKAKAARNSKFLQGSTIEIRVNSPSPRDLRRGSSGYIDVSLIDKDGNTMAQITGVKYYPHTQRIALGSVSLGTWVTDSGYERAGLSTIIQQHITLTLEKWFGIGQNYEATCVTQASRSYTRRLINQTRYSRKKVEVKRAMLLNLLRGNPIREGIDNFAKQYGISNYLDEQRSLDLDALESEIPKSLIKAAKKGKLTVAEVKKIFNPDEQGGAFGAPGSPAFRTPYWLQVSQGSQDLPTESVLRRRVSRV